MSDLEPAFECTPIGALAAAQAAIARLTKERDSAVSMESIGKSFHDLAVKERDLAQYQLTNAKAEIARLTAEVDQLKNWIDHHSTELPRLTMQRDTAHNDAIEAAAAVCAEKKLSFSSNEYAVGQPLSSFAERFACDQCEDAIRALKRPT